jgi:Na+-driven multidrug efflux pump
LYQLNRSIPFQLLGLEKGFFQQAMISYVKAGGLIFLRTIAKISTYTVASSSAAKPGTIPMAAYTLTFSLGFTASQLCESLAIAAQALIARDMPLNSKKKQLSARHVIKRSLQSGLLVSLGLTTFTILNLNKILNQMTKSNDVRIAAMQIIPLVLMTQIFKGVSSSTGGILLGGLDWSFSTAGMIIASVLSILSFYLLPKSLMSIWFSLAVFTSSQVITAMIRIYSDTGPWKNLYGDTSLNNRRIEN